MLFVSIADSIAESSDDALLRLQKGEYYFHYLTENFPRAINQLENWQQQAGGKASEAQIMNAAMMLSLGLHGDAEKDFSEIFGQQPLPKFIGAIEQGVGSPQEQIEQQLQDSLAQQTAVGNAKALDEQGLDQTGDTPVTKNADKDVSPETHGETVKSEQVENTPAAVKTVVEKNAVLEQVSAISPEQTSRLNLEQDILDASGRAWFFLGKRWFELAQWLPAYKALYQAQRLGVEPELWHEMSFMQVSSLIELGEIKQAAKALAVMDKTNIWTAYARHNFVLAYLGGNATGRSLSLFLEDTLFYIPSSKEGKSLKDRISLVAGVHFLESGKARNALKYFQMISLDGSYTAPALLYYGWALIELWKYEQALQPWRELQASYNPYSHESIESLASVPYVLELLDVQTQALRTYEFTEKRIQTLLDRLQGIQKGFDDDSWLSDWLAQQNPSQWGWTAGVEDIFSQSEMTEALHGLFTSDLFVSELARLRDLNNLEQYLAQRKTNLVLWRSMVERRRSYYAKSAAGNKLAKLKQQLKGYEQGAQYLQTVFAALQSDSDLLKTSQESKKIKQLEVFKPTLQQLLNTKFGRKSAQSYQERERRVSGVLKWQEYDRFADRKWRAEKALHKLQQVIFKTKIQLAESEQANLWAATNNQGFKARINQQQKSVSQLHKEAKQLKDEQYLHVQTLAQDYLLELHGRLKTYLSQTKLAIARLYDDSLQQIKETEQQREDDEELNDELENDVEEQSSAQESPAEAQQVLDAKSANKNEGAMPHG